MPPGTPMLALGRWSLAHVFPSQGWGGVFCLGGCELLMNGWLVRLPFRRPQVGIALEFWHGLHQRLDGCVSKSRSPPNLLLFFCFPLRPTREGPPSKKRHAHLRAQNLPRAKSSASPRRSPPRRRARRCAARRRRSWSRRRPGGSEEMSQREGDV